MYELTNDRYLVDTGATLSIAPSTTNASPSDPSLGSCWQPIPSCGYVSKTVQFQGKLFTVKFLQAGVAGPILGMGFLRKFRITVAPETSQVLFTCTATALAAAKSFLPYFSPIAEPSVSAPPATQPIPDSVPEDVKLLLQKFTSILHTGDVMPIPTHGVEHHIHTGSHPPVFAKYRRLDSEKHEIAKAEFKRLESTSTVRRSKSPWASHLHMVPKKMDPGDLVAINAVSIWLQPLTSTPC
jgi:hypothetical protein